MVVWPLRWTSSRLCFQVWRNSWLFRRMAFSKGWANRAPKWYIPCFYWWSRAASEFADFWMCYPNETIFAWSACLNFKAKSTMLPKTPKSAEVMCLIQLLSFHLFSFFGTATTTNHQPPTTNHQPPTTNHQPPTTNHQPPQPSSKILTIGARTHCWLGEWKGGSAQWKDWRGEAAQKDFFLGQVYSCSKAVFFFGGGLGKSETQIGEQQESWGLLQHGFGWRELDWWIWVWFMEFSGICRCCWDFGLNVFCKNLEAGETWSSITTGLGMIG